MRFAADRPFSDPDKAARKLVEIANTVEAVLDGRIHIELINLPFLQCGGSVAEYTPFAPAGTRTRFLSIHGPRPSRRMRFRPLCDGAA
jgi:hypothetical protein